MACIDVDSLAQYEREAKYRASPMRFTIWVWPIPPARAWRRIMSPPTNGSISPPCAAVNEAKSWRNQIAEEMNAGQIAQAQKLAREWLNIFK